MPHSESPASSPPVATPTSKDSEQMDQDDNAPVKAESQDETNGDITMADIDTVRTAQETKETADGVQLEDLFNDMDSDDEFSGAKKATPNSTLPTSSAAPASSPVNEQVDPFDTARPSKANIL